MWPLTIAFLPPLLPTQHNIILLLQIYYVRHQYHVVYPTPRLYVRIYIYLVQINTRCLLADKIIIISTESYEGIFHQFLLFFFFGNVLWIYCDFEGLTVRKYTKLVYVYKLSIYIINIFFIEIDFFEILNPFYLIIK